MNEPLHLDFSETHKIGNLGIIANLVTTRKRSMGEKVMFFFTSVCDSVHRGVSVQGEGSLSRLEGGICPGGSLSQRPPYGNDWAVCILLECILVFPYIYSFLLYPHHLMLVNVKLDISGHKKVANFDGLIHL